MRGSLSALYGLWKDNRSREDMLMTPRELKAALRTERLALRDSMPAEARIEASLKMLDHAGDIIDFQPGQIISGFWPIRSEVDLRPLMALGRGAARARRGLRIPGTALCVSRR